MKKQTMHCDECKKNWDVTPGEDMTWGIYDCVYCERSLCGICYALHSCKGHKPMTKKEFRDEFGDRLLEYMADIFDEVDRRGSTKSTPSMSWETPKGKILN